MTVIGRGRGIALSVALLVSGTAAASVAAPANGPTSPVTRYVPVIGNAQYLVYAEAIRINPISPTSFNPHVNLFVLGKHGGPIPLGPVGQSPFFYSLSRSNFMDVRTDNGESHVEWWNLATGHHREQVTSENVVGASPDGWLFEVQELDGVHVMSQAYSGKLTDLGNPLAPGVDYAVTSGPNGFVAYADNFENENGQFTYTSWSHPHQHLTLLTAKHQNNFCASVSSRFAACMLGTVAHPLVLLPLDGRKPTIKTGTCASDYTVWGSGIGLVVGGAGTVGCNRGSVGEMSRTGHLTFSTRTFSVITVASAWGRLVASSRVQRGLVTLTSARAKPHPLTRATISPPDQ